MEQTIESILVYSSAALLCIVIITWYIRKKSRESKIVDEKIKKAREDGLFEPVSLHPVVDVNSCIQTGACISACPEHDILGIRNGKATTINASQCIGHGACFHACPTHAITLRIGTEKRGVDIPHVSQNFETNVPGIYIAGELGGMGLIKNAVEQGRQAAENIFKSHKKNHGAEYDLVIVGAGPAGISAGLTAKKHGLNFIILEQDTLGGTVFTFPRKKIVMTSPMDLPLYGKIKLFETSKTELLELWQTVLKKNDILVKENAKVESIVSEEGRFRLKTLNSDEFTASRVLLSIGRRGTPRKLNIPGESKEKVAYRLLEPENISGKNIIVVGGGDSAVESALLLAEQNHVTLSYRNDVFNRIKPLNTIELNKAVADGKLELMLGSNLLEIEDEKVRLSKNAGGETIHLKNDLVFIFAGGELPTQFLEKAGIRITRKFGETVLKH
ncbi:MAG: NAD(P)-binding domain-containing protein [Bacteroidales bacterium]|nr:NAD(P)-binding domain-containing protein [Bacteroidales bacterium]MCB8998899.1 NAD(P)-binding domain-containing protein [Bacteroidales bacterium]